MAVTITEKPTSREMTGSVERPGAILRYTAIGDEDEQVVAAAVVSGLLGTITVLGYPLILQEWHLTPAGGGNWDVEANYGARQPRDKDGGSNSGNNNGQNQGGTQEFSFDTTGGKQNIKQSLDTKTYRRSTIDPVIDYHGAIEVHEDKVEGVEITVPQFAFQVGRTIAHPVSGAYLNLLYHLTGKVNSDTVIVPVNSTGNAYSFAPGELLYLGAQGKQSGVQPWNLALHFAASLNAIVTIDDIQGVDKPGWDYIWLTYETEVDADAKMLVKRPIQANVEQVYKRAPLQPLLL